MGAGCNLYLAIIIVLVLVLAAGAWQGRRARGLHDEMARLWFDHVDRTNLFIISTLGGLPDASAVAAHLQANQDDIGAALGKYYGKAAGKTVANLLHEHISIAGQIVVTLKAGGTRAR